MQSKKTTHEVWYRDNRKYTSFLESQTVDSYTKYVDWVCSLYKKGYRFLDIGCGTGTTLNEIRKKNKSYDIQGVEISKTSVAKCKKRGLKCRHYDGKTIPAKDKAYDCVGSINVLEHTDKPLLFLNEAYRVTKKGGHIIVICPNFLSITNNYHKNTKGVKRKIINIYTFFSKLASSKIVISKMEPTLRTGEFLPDDDAVNEANPLDILRWAQNKNLKVIYCSSQQQYQKGFSKFLDTSVLRYFLGSCFFVFQK